MHPVRRRAGLLSSLAKLYATVRRLLNSEGTTEEALELQQKLHARYTSYLESHENALVAVPEREHSLTTSHIDFEERHQEAVEMLQAYIDDGNKSERSLHMRSLFSSRSSNAGTLKTVSTKHSSRRSSRSAVSQANSNRLSEARIQAELAKKNAEQQQIMQEAHQRRLAAERETARHRMVFEQQAAHRKAELDREATRLQMELEEQARQRSLLQEETERQHRELEEEMETRRQVAEYEKLRAEVQIREREEVRSNFASDYESSDEERSDVTRPKKTATKILGFQSIDDQQESMREILRAFSKPKDLVEDKPAPQRNVTNWLEESDKFSSQKLKVPFNTPAQPRERYVPATQVRRDQFNNQPQPEKQISLVGISENCSNARRTIVVRATSPKVPICGRPDGP